jgi:hypothetical protein
MAELSAFWLRWLFSHGEGVMVRCGWFDGGFRGGSRRPCFSPVPASLDSRWLVVVFWVTLVVVAVT